MEVDNLRIEGPQMKTDTTPYGSLERRKDRVQYYAQGTEYGYLKCKLIRQNYTDNAWVPIKQEERRRRQPRTIL